jgi:hypothetical protein
MLTGTVLRFIGDENEVNKDEEQEEQEEGEGNARSGDSEQGIWW